jgi:hypothetical protein
MFGLTGIRGRVIGGIPKMTLRAAEAEAMPKAWSPKDERMYEHIKEGEQHKEGRSAGRAKQIAAATVNKKRKEQGRTKQQKSR